MEPKPLIFISPTNSQLRSRGQLLIQRGVVLEEQKILSLDSPYIYSERHMASRRIIIPGSSSLTGRLQLRVLHSIGGFDYQAVYVAKTKSCCETSRTVTTRTFSRQQSLDYLAISQPAGCVSVLHKRAMLGGPCTASSMQRKSSLHSHCLHNSTQQPLIPITRQQQRQLSSRPSPRRGNKKKVDDNIPLLNEHLIAELFNRMKGHSGTISADTYEVRLIVEQGNYKKKETMNDENGDNDATSKSDENDTSTASSSTTKAKTTPSSQLTTLNEAITIAHEHALDLMEVTLHVSPPVIKAVDFDKWQYEQKKKQAQLTSKKKKEGGGAISDRPLKEFQFRAGIADHDLERKTNNMLKYLSKGHAIRVTLTARNKSLVADAEAIHTTLERVKELVGDKAIEARGLKANDRKSAGSLVLHPPKSTKG